jgi:hypothetical protein
MARKVARRVTAKQVLDLGLKIAGANERQRNTSLTTQLRRFKTCFGSDPLVYARIWADLAQIDLERKLVYFLICLYWFKGYHKESDLALKFGLDEETIRDWTWYYAECIQELKVIKVRNDEENKCRKKIDTLLLTLCSLDCFPRQF